MRFVKDDVDVFAPVTWFFAADGAKPFPGLHRFGSANWDSTRNEVSDLGDDATVPKTYANGRRLNRSDGRKFAGPILYFLEGAPGEGTIPRGADGTPVECLVPPFGIALGARAVPVIPVRAPFLLGGSGYAPAVPCSECFGPTPAHVSITLSGFTTPSLNQLWNLVQDPLSPCQWTASSGGNTLTLSRAGGFFWPLTISDGVGGATYQGSGASCIGSFSMSQLASTIGGDDPLTLFTF